MYTHTFKYVIEIFMEIHCIRFRLCCNEKLLLMAVNIYAYKYTIYLLKS